MDELDVRATSLKKCTQCGESKPPTEYHLNGKGGRRAECRACSAEYQQERSKTPDYLTKKKEWDRAYRIRNRARKAASQRKWRAKNKEKAIAASKRWKEKALANPETRAEWNERRRLLYSLKVYRETGQWPHRKAKRNGHDRPVSAEVLKRWIEDKVEEYGGPTYFAHACKIDERVIYRLRHEDFEEVSLWLVDDILSGEGSTHYSELYPDV